MPLGWDAARRNLSSAGRRRSGSSLNQHAASESIATNAASRSFSTALDPRRYQLRVPLLSSRRCRRGGRAECAPFRSGDRRGTRIGWIAARVVGGRTSDGHRACPFCCCRSIGRAPPPSTSLSRGTAAARRDGRSPMRFRFSSARFPLRFWWWIPTRIPATARSPARDVALYLSRHGAKVVVEQVRSNGEPVATSFSVLQNAIIRI